MKAPMLIACRVVIEEMRPFLPEGMAAEVLEMSLHTRPNRLREALQAAVNAADGRYDPILLGYGLCSRAVVGLVAQASRLVMPRGDDCIGLFLGSQRARLEEAQSVPGTYFLTGGWIGESAGAPFTDYDRMVRRYGPEKAGALMGKMLRHYRRLAYIRMPNRADLEADRARARDIAARFSLEYAEIDGTPRWLERMLAGDWGEDFIVVAPGEPLRIEHFLEQRSATVGNPEARRGRECSARGDS